MICSVQCIINHQISVYGCLNSSHFFIEHFCCYPSITVTKGSWLPGPTPSWIPLSFPGIQPSPLPYDGRYLRWRLCTPGQGFWIPLISRWTCIKIIDNLIKLLIWVTEISQLCITERKTSLLTQLCCINGFKGPAAIISTSMQCNWPWGSPRGPAGLSPGSQWSARYPDTGRCGSHSAWGSSCPGGYSYHPPPCPALAVPGRKYKLHVWITETGGKAWAWP